METHQPISTIRRRAVFLALACLLGPLAMGGRVAAQDLAELELSRRSAGVQEAQELLRKGDEAYQAGRYADAVEAFAGARELIPAAPVSGELRAAATERYVQASIEKARVLSGKGDVAAAMAAVDEVLSDGVAPNDPAALAFRALLNDPIRTNPALTAAHAQDVDQVRRLLYSAEGAFNLGKFDESNAQYKEVLRIDPTNTAARRGMERVASAKSGYQKAAYDHTRAEMLGQVGAAWENWVPETAPDLGFGPEDPGGLPGLAGEMSVAAKIRQIIIPRIALDQATLSEAVELLRALSMKEDGTGGSPDSRGVNFTLNLGPPDSETSRSIRSLKFDLQLSQVPLAEAIRHITEITRTSFTTDDFAVVITPAGSTSSELISRNYRVPPDFISSLSGNVGDAGADADPFGDAAQSSGLLTRRMSAQEALANQGIGFPEGASASYSPATNTLRVTNTALNHDIVSQIIDVIAQAEPVTVSVKVTMIKTQQTALEELSFDWLMTPFNLNNNNNLLLGGGSDSNTVGRTAADFNPAIPLPSDPRATISRGVVTNGLRSGNQAFSPNETIDDLINNPDRSDQLTAVAPGILSVTGLFSDGQAQLVMRGLNQKKGIDLMSKPSILTRSGQAASILIAREFIYPSEYEPPELPNTVGADLQGSFPVTPATPTAFETREVGVSLEVLPVADANKRYIDITLNPTITDLDGFVNFGSPITANFDSPLGTTRVNITDNAILMPVFSSRRASTQLTIADGATIVFGGLVSDSLRRVEDKVPVLGDLPFVGRFFRSSSRKPISNVVIFMVHVELLDPTGRPYRDR